jgi:hypothetical protein
MPEEADRERDAEVIDISDLMAVEREKQRLEDLDREVFRIEAKLPPDHRRLCEQLKKRGVSGAAKEMRKSRTWVYERVKEIRPLFERELHHED